MTMLSCKYVVNPKTQNILKQKDKNKTNYIKIQKFKRIGMCFL